LHDEIGAKTLFATHYHELNELASRYNKIKNYHVEVIEAHNKVLFTHQVIAGASDHSFGIYVANIAGLPQEVTDRANEIMQELESSSDINTKQDQLFDNSKLKAKLQKVTPKKKSNVATQLSIFEVHDDKLRSKLLEIDINSITPIQAMQHLEDLQKDAK
jgi:DNA mismatch repair protein MutS